MKKLFSSLTVFVSKGLRNTLILLLAVSAFFVAASVILVNIKTESEFLNGFIFTFLPMLSIVAPCAGMGVLNRVYTMNYPINPGYRYLHSIPDSMGRFRQAIIGANLLAAGMGLFGAAAAAAISLIAMPQSGALLPLMCVILMFFTIGLGNFTAYVKNMWLRLASVFLLCGAAGFAAGFASGDEEEALMPDMKLTTIFAAVGAVFFAASIVYTLTQCKKKWGELQ